MKKVLLATTALVLSAGVAAADVKLGGTARAGIVHNDSATSGSSKTTVNMRLRFNIDMSKQLDSGVTLGGRIRMQYDQGRLNDTSSVTTVTVTPVTPATDPATSTVTSTTTSSNRSGATLNAAYLYASIAGFRVEVGNANTAYDASALLYNAELGYTSFTQGGYNLSSYTDYQTNPYGSSQTNRMGVYASYTVGDLVGRISYITPNQTVTNLGAGTEEELSVSASYKTGGVTLAAAYAANGNFIKDNDIFFLGAEYAFNDVGSVGLQYFDHGKIAGLNQGSSVTLYGRYVLPAGIGLGAFVSAADNTARTNQGLTDKTAFGIGFDYDLGGATLAGTVQKTHSDATVADLGIRFSF